MEKTKYKTPKKGAGSRLRELSIKRREQSKPSQELLEVLKTPTKQDKTDKQSAISKKDKDLEI